uniref:Uncharacterized protein n=1 Tax=Sphaerodactylus townsendi TaxID=933632 RepID=A0ACB8F3A1_9SAUR
MWPGFPNPRRELVFEMGKAGKAHTHRYHFSKSRVRDPHPNCSSAWSSLLLPQLLFIVGGVGAVPSQPPTAGLPSQSGQVKWLCLECSSVITQPSLVPIN